MTEIVKKRVGRPPGLHITKQFSVALPLEQYIAMNERAVYEDCSMGEVVRKAVAAFLRDHQVVAE